MKLTHRPILSPLLSKVRHFCKHPKEPLHKPWFQLRKANKKKWSCLSIVKWVVGFCAALQARSSYNSWESLSPEGFALNSKWYEAEKYICNPLSGEVPMECLSAKTLSARSFRNFRTRITMSAPLVYSTNSRQLQDRPINFPQEEAVHQYPIPGIITSFCSLALKGFFEAGFNIEEVHCLSCRKESGGDDDQGCGNSKHTT